MYAYVVGCLPHRLLSTFVCQHLCDHLLNVNTLQWALRILLLLLFIYCYCHACCCRPSTAIFCCPHNSIKCLVVVQQVYMCTPASWQHVPATCTSSHIVTYADTQQDLQYNGPSSGKRATKNEGIIRAHIQAILALLCTHTDTHICMLLCKFVCSKCQTSNLHQRPSLVSPPPAYLMHFFRLLLLFPLLHTLSMVMANLCTIFRAFKNICIINRIHISHFQFIACCCCWLRIAIW